MAEASFPFRATVVVQAARVAEFQEVAASVGEAVGFTIELSPTGAGPMTHRALCTRMSQKMMAMLTGAYPVAAIYALGSPYDLPDGMTAESIAGLLDPANGHMALLIHDPAQAGPILQGVPAEAPPLEEGLQLANPAAQVQTLLDLLGLQKLAPPPLE